MKLCRQAAGRVGQHDVDVARLGRRDGVEDHRRRIAAVLRDDRDVVALAPCDELLPRRGAKGVAGGQQHRLALRLEVVGQLADRGGLAGAVHAGDHDDEGLVRYDVERLLQGLQQPEQQVGQRLLQVARAFRCGRA